MVFLLKDINVAIASIKTREDSCRINLSKFLSLCLCSINCSTVSTIKSSFSIAIIRRAHSAYAGTYTLYQRDDKKRELLSSLFLDICVTVGLKFDMGL